MATTLKILGQSKPSAASLTDLYTVPASTSTIINTLIITNQSATSTTFRISLAIAGATDTPAQYIAYDATILGNDVKVYDIQIALSAADKIRVYNTLATCSFTASGTEIA